MRLPMRMSVFWTAWLAALLTGFVLYSLEGPVMGMGLLPYNIAFAFFVIVAVAAWPMLLRRRVASVGLAITGTLAAVTGFVLLYADTWLRAHLVLSTMRFWHSVVSAAMLPFFTAHFLHNRVRLTQFLRRIGARRYAAAAYVGGWVGLGVWLAATWWPGVGATIPETAYRPLVDATWPATLLVLVAAWAGARALSPHLARPFVRNDRRALVDATILGTFLLVVVTGFLLVYVEDALRDHGLGVVALFWHTAPSIVFVVLIALHVGANARALVAHGRRVVREIDGEDGAPRG